MADPKTLEEDAVQFASRAVHCDKECLVDTAIFYYREAAEALLAASSSGSTVPNILTKVNEYVSRAEILASQRGGVTSFTLPTKSAQQLKLERAHFLVSQAFQEDEAGNTEEALQLYTEAAETCLNLRQDPALPKDLQTKVTKLAQQSLDRAESLKSPQAVPDHRSSAPAPHKFYPLGESLREEGDQGRRAHGNAAHGNAPHGNAPKSMGGGYTKQELQVLRITSSINGREYVPFLNVDLREKFAYPVAFSDKDGFLQLSPKQRQKFSNWARPDDIYQDPTIIYVVSSFSIKQTIVSDCSFVASLAISAQYERRFKKKLITSLIYPQNRKGEPVHNPCGKYMVKLNINGVSRKIVIDDYLPVSKSGDLLCSYSSNRNELWVSLLEKAYLKVMGGYDFPGSNSNIDLHALTGWVPERVSVKATEFAAEREFERLFERFHQGHCLITVATGEMGEEQAERAGLVPTHAYALLDIRKVQNIRLIQLKNPWSHCRWRGNYSEKDVVHWTASMKQALNFDPKSAELIDNGVFWIDYESLLKFFDVIYINWNPDLFPYTTCVHHTWTAKEGPRKDSYNIGDNPQFNVGVKTSGPKAVWILLTRHIMDKEDFANNKEFITVLVYKGTGKRIFYPYDPPPYKDGVRINSPHYLCKLVEDGSQNYTLVVSQYDKANTIHFTLRVYATVPFTFSQISEPYLTKYEKQMTGEWKGKSAGGCSNFKESHLNNPVYQMKVEGAGTDHQVMIELRGPKQYSVGFEVTCVSENASSQHHFQKTSSGDYRRGFCVLELENLPQGLYNIRPSTFNPQQEGPFILNISASMAITLTRLQ